jgi:hypothetical protein
MTFWDLTVCSPLKVNRSFRVEKQDQVRNQRENRLRTMSLGLQRIKLHYIPEDNTLHKHRCENLKSYTGKKKFCP